MSETTKAASRKPKADKAPPRKPKGVVVQDPASKQGPAEATRNQYPPASSLKPQA